MFYITFSQMFWQKQCTHIDRGDKANVGKVNSEYRYLSLSCNLSLGLKFFIKLGEVINTQADR